MEDLLEDHPILNQQTEMSTFNMFFKTPVEPTPQEPTVIQPSTDKFLHTIRPTLHLVVTAPNTDETRDYSTHIVSVLTSSGINVILEFQNPSDLSLCFLEDDDNLLILTAELSWSLQSSFQLHSKLNGQMRNVTLSELVISIAKLWFLKTPTDQLLLLQLHLFPYLLDDSIAPSVLSTLYESLNPFVTVPAAEQSIAYLTSLLTATENSFQHVPSVPQPFPDPMKSFLPSTQLESLSPRDSSGKLEVTSHPTNTPSISSSTKQEFPFIKRLHTLLEKSRAEVIRVETFLSSFTPYALHSSNPQFDKEKFLEDLNNAIADPYGASTTSSVIEFLRMMRQQGSLLLKPLLSSVFPNIPPFAELELPSHHSSIFLSRSPLIQFLHSRSDLQDIVDDLSFLETHFFGKAIEIKTKHLRQSVKHPIETIFHVHVDGITDPSLHTFIAVTPKNSALCIHSLLCSPSQTIIDTRTQLKTSLPPLEFSFVQNYFRNFTMSQSLYSFFKELLKDRLTTIDQASQLLETLSERTQSLEELLQDTNEQQEESQGNQSKKSKGTKKKSVYSEFITFCEQMTSTLLNTASTAFYKNKTTREERRKKEWTKFKAALHHTNYSHLKQQKSEVAEIIQQQELKNRTKGKDGMTDEERLIKARIAEIRQLEALENVKFLEERRKDDEMRKKEVWLMSELKTLINNVDEDSLRDAETKLGPQKGGTEAVRGSVAAGLKEGRKTVVTELDDDKELPAPAPKPAETRSDSKESETKTDAQSEQTVTQPSTPSETVGDEEGWRDETTESVNDNRSEKGSMSMTKKQRRKEEKKQEKALMAQKREQERKEKEEERKRKEESDKIRAHQQKVKETEAQINSILLMLKYLEEDNQRLAEEKRQKEEEKSILPIEDKPQETVQPEKTDQKPSEPTESQPPAASIAQPPEQKPTETVTKEEVMEDNTPQTDETPTEVTQPVSLKEQSQPQPQVESTKECPVQESQNGTEDKPEEEHPEQDDSPQPSPAPDQRPSDLPSRSKSKRSKRKKGNGTLQSTPTEINTLSSFSLTECHLCSWHSHPLLILLDKTFYHHTPTPNCPLQYETEAVEIQLPLFVKHGTELKMLMAKLRFIETDNPEDELINTGISAKRDGPVAVYDELFSMLSLESFLKLLISFDSVLMFLQRREGARQEAEANAAEPAPAPNPTPSSTESPDEGNAQSTTSHSTPSLPLVPHVWVRLPFQVLCEKESFIEVMTDAESVRRKQEAALRQGERPVIHASSMSETKQIGRIVFESLLVHDVKDADEILRVDKILGWDETSVLSETERKLAESVLFDFEKRVSINDRDRWEICIIDSPSASVLPTGEENGLGSTDSTASPAFTAGTQVPHAGSGATASTHQNRPSGITQNGASHAGLRSEREEEVRKSRNERLRQVRDPVERSEEAKRQKKDLLVESARFLEMLASKQKEMFEKKQKEDERIKEKKKAEMLAKKKEEERIRKEKEKEIEQRRRQKKEEEKRKREEKKKEEKKSEEERKRQREEKERQRVEEKRKEEALRQQQIEEQKVKEEQERLQRAEKKKQERMERERKVAEEREQERIRMEEEERQRQEEEERKKRMKSEKKLVKKRAKRQKEQMEKEEEERQIMGDEDRNIIQTINSPQFGQHPPLSIEGEADGSLFRTLGMPNSQLGGGMGWLGTDMTQPGFSSEPALFSDSLDPFGSLGGGSMSFGNGGEMIGSGQIPLSASTTSAFTPISSQMFGTSGQLFSPSLNITDMQLPSAFPEEPQSQMFQPKSDQTFP